MRKFIDWIEAGAMVAIDNYGRKKTIKEYFTDLMFLFLIAPLAMVRVLIEPLNIVATMILIGIFLGIGALLN